MAQIHGPFPSSGSSSLEVTEDYCQLLQRNAESKVIRITKDTNETNGKRNQILLEDFGKNPPRMELVEVKNPGDVQTIINEQLNAGRKFVFDSIIFIENKDARILAFRAD